MQRVSKSPPRLQKTAPEMVAPVGVAARERRSAPCHLLATCTVHNTCAQEDSAGAVDAPLAYSICIGLYGVGMLHYAAQCHLATVAALAHRRDRGCW